MAQARLPDESGKINTSQAIRARKHACADEAFVSWLTENGYHPRSNAHSDALCELVVKDVIHHDPSLAEAALQGRLVYQLNYDMGLGNQAMANLEWNIDLVLGPPLGGTVAPMDGQAIRRANPRTVYAAVDAKGVMTEHGKARRNRQRDLTALHAVVHAFYPRAVAGGIVAVNAAEKFISPLRQQGDITLHRNIERLTEETVELFRSVPRASPQGGVGLEAVGVFVISYTNIRGSRAELLSKPPAPAVNSSVSYQSFLRDFSAALGARFPF